ncbi:MAG: nucleotide exchange factor GrpE [Parcubacteria group bacterium]|jgi:molecular chaperone GrpE|nr:nucleotide exchange factor GrpE [Parcubacteria group bacterium]|tara:strand:+ start:1497 stop:1964 length:468 start_codon:yes stop_codon:yes gene_type:complete
MKKKITYISEDSETTGHKSKKLKQRIKQCQKEKEEYLSQTQRARADLINYRRRQEQIVEQLRNYGQASLIEQLLPVLDSLEIGSKDSKGIKRIKEQMDSILQKYDVKEIKAVGQKFNPELHEAIEGKGEMIIKEIQKGYTLNNKVLRTSKVKLAK